MYTKLEKEFGTEEAEKLMREINAHNKKAVFYGMDSAGKTADEIFQKLLILEGVQMYEDLLKKESL